LHRKDFKLVKQKYIFINQSNTHFYSATKLTQIRQNSKQFKSHSIESGNAKVLKKIIIIILPS